MSRAGIKDPERPSAEKVQDINLDNAGDNIEVGCRGGEAPQKRNSENDQGKAPGEVGPNIVLLIRT